jgi:hypothetical protein
MLRLRKEERREKRSRLYNQLRHKNLYFVRETGGPYMAVFVSSGQKFSPVPSNFWIPTRSIKHRLITKLITQIKVNL